MFQKFECSFILSLFLVGAAEGASFADLTGVWQMQGYGRLIEVNSESVARYDVTDISCIRDRQMTLAEANRAFDRVKADVDRFSAYEAGGITRYDFVRLDSLPGRCGLFTKPVADPELNFSVLWHAFRENYAFFELHLVDWGALYERFRPELQASTTDDKLFDILSQVLAELDDGHVSLQAAGREFNSGKLLELDALWIEEQGSEDWDAIGPGYHATVKRHVEQDVLGGKYHFGANGILAWGWAAPGVGYLDIAAMRVPLGEDAQATSLDDQAVLIDAAMSQLFQDLAGLEVLIVDARFNPGGEDAVALRIMGHLLAEERVAFTKKAVRDTGFTETQSIRVVPVGEARYTGPVVFLQGGTTASAAEIFTLAMMARPNVTSVGRTTYGVLSDTLDKRLPNGWTVSLSNEVYVAVDGQLYEGTGIPPDVAVDAIAGESLQERLTRVYAAGLQQAQERQKR